MHDGGYPARRPSVLEPLGDAKFEEYVHSSETGTYDATGPELIELVVSPVFHIIVDAFLFVPNFGVGLKKKTSGGTYGEEHPFFPLTWIGVETDFQRQFYVVGGNLRLPDVPIGG